MNKRFITLTKAVTKRKIAISKYDILDMEEDTTFTNTQVEIDCTRVTYREESKWVKVTETIEDILAKLEAVDNEN